MNIKKNKTIGIRTDDHFLKILEGASKMYNASKSEIVEKKRQKRYGDKYWKPAPLILELYEKNGKFI